MADQKLRVDITAKDRTKQAFSRVQRSLGKLKKSLLNIKTLLGAAFAAIAVRSLTRFVNKAVDAGDKIAKTARAIGITTDKLQELRFAADLSGISVESLDSAMLGFSKRVGELRAGTGTLFTILNKTDEVLLKQVQTAGSVDQAFDHIIRATRQLGNEMDKSALLSAAFGRTAGTAFKNLVPDIERLSQEARDLGLVIDNSLLLKAEDTKNKLTVLGQVLNVKFVKFVLENARAIDALAEALMKAGTAAGKWIADMGPAASAGPESLKRRIAEINEQLAKFQDGAKGAQLGFERFLGSASGYVNLITNTKSARAEFNALNKELKRLKGLLKEATSEPMVLEITNAASIDYGMYSGKAHFDFAQTYKDKIQLMGRYREEQALAIKETERQDAAMRQLSTTIEDSLIDSLSNLATGFENWRDVARSALKSVIRSMLQYVNAQAGMGGSGGIGGLIFKGLGSLFGGSTQAPKLPPLQIGAGPQGWGGPLTMMAKGGSLGKNQPAIVGEQGPELFVPKASGQVMPNGSFGGGVTVHQTINLSTGVQATVRAEVMGMLPQIAASTKSAVLSARVRGGAFAKAFEA